MYHLSQSISTIWRISDGDILATELNKYGQHTRLTVSLVSHHKQFYSVGSEFGICDGVIVPIIPELQSFQSILRLQSTQKKIPL